MNLRDRPLRILLIDDDEDDHWMFSRMVEEIAGSQWRVEWAPSASVGRQKLQEQQHDICFLDYRLGGETGLDLLKDSAANSNHIPIVLLTGYGEEEVDIAAMRYGAADYLVKDQINATIIERCIRYAIHRAETLEKLREREAQVLMQDRLASVGLLASSLAHEIGTPLGVIRGRAELMEAQLVDQPGLQKHVDVIISQIDRVSALIRSLLNLARGDASYGKSEILLNQVVDEVIDLMGHELRKHKIDLVNEISRDLNVKVNAAAAPLHQVLLNLLVNSMHAIDSAVQKQDRKSGHYVHLRAFDTGGTWTLEVSDSGCGISPANMRNLFKPFFTTKDIGVGTGLGLATTYRIIEGWGGSIHVESVEGEGTSFRIVLPKAEKGTDSKS